MFLIGIMFDLVIAVGNLIYMERISGMNNSSRLFGPFYLFFGQFGLILYFFVILNFLRSCGGHVTENITIDMMTQHLASMAYCIPPGSFCCCFIPYFYLVFPGFQNEFLSVYIIGNGLLALLFGFLITYAFRFVLKYLEDHISHFDQVSYEIRSIYNRLKRAYYICAIISAIVGIILVAFGSSSYLWKRSNYVFIFMRIVIPICGTILVKTTHSAMDKQHRSTDSTNSPTENGFEFVLESPVVRKSSAFIAFSEKFRVKIFRFRTSDKIIPIE
jgi:hypothetical protein